MNIDVFSRDSIPSLLRGNTLVLVDSPRFYIDVIGPGALAKDISDTL